MSDLLKELAAEELSKFSKEALITKLVNRMTTVELINLAENKYGKMKQFE